MTLISNLESEVILRVENQTTQTARADVWIRDSILEIAGNTDYRDDFDQLEEFGPLFNLTGGPVGVSVQEYPFSNFIPIGDYNISTLDVMLWTDFPTNQIRKKLNPSHYQEADKFNQFPSIPCDWYRFADTLGFDPPPNQNYQTQIRIMRRHPITDYFNAQGLLNTTVILLPTEWNEVIIWMATMRGFMEFLNFERAGTIRTLLYGDPKDQKNPGLIQSIKKRRDLEAWRDAQPLRPVIQGSCWGNY